ncbi:unnamed protein product [Mucor circinelloides]|uniref:G-protein coupled receptors family 1 profile domain-containing protein n=1 Tax=Mucor circinelloides f. circinelloides (strain 1006PhL) TaxID=1220926 RepID=S2JZ41_MUCC1|nr:hypothetical protein HMPREF1544_05155 [Mucor circinelloides 1006PhL]
MASPLAVATIALQGASVGVSGELAVRSLFRKKDKTAVVRAAKFFLGICMALKSVLFLSFHASQGKSCYITGRVADLLYHLAMTAGNHVLVTRVQSIVPINWRRRALIFHTSLTALRLIIGIVDVALIHISNYPDGTCKYTDEEFWGPVYTLYDTLIDLYVTIMISAILISHIRSLVSDRMRVNKLLYTSVIYHNVIRTICLTIVNLISAIFIIMKNQVDVIMLLWPIINICFVILVGYDSDVTKAIRKLQQKRWRTLSNMTSTIDLGNVPSVARHTMKRPLSSSRSDPELAIPSDNTKENTEDEDDNMNVIHTERWKSRLSSTMQQNADLDNMNTRPPTSTIHPNSAHLPPHDGTTSYDTDHTRI